MKIWALRSRWHYLGVLRSTGIRLYAHWSVLLVVALFAVGAFSDPLIASALFISVLALILIHELGHAWVARRLGLEVTAIHFSLLHGRCTHETAEYEWDEVRVAWGGVLAQLLVAIPLLVISAQWRSLPEVFEPVVIILGYFSLLTAAFNLLPAPGLDGALAWRAVPMLWAEWRSRRVVGSVLKRIRSGQKK